MANLNNRILGRISLIGICAVLVIDLIDAAKSSGSLGVGFTVWLVMTAAAAGTSLVLMPKALTVLLRNLQLLVPLALLIITTRLLGWLMLLPALGSLLTRSLPFHFLSFSTALSLSLVLYILLSIAYAAWTTVLVVKCVDSDACNPASAIFTARQKFLHIFGMECIGTIVLMLGSTLLLLLMKVNFVIALGGMALFGTAWNLATAALLPVTVEHKGNFMSAFRAGVSASLANVHRWGLLLIAQMLLLGLVIYYYRSSGGTSNSDFAVNTFWTGGYESDCRWYPSVAKRFNTYTMPLFETLLSLVFGAFAVAIKLAITQRLGKRS